MKRHPEGTREQWRFISEKIKGDGLSFTINYVLEEFGEGGDEGDDEDGRPPPGTTDVSGMVRIFGVLRVHIAERFFPILPVLLVFPGVYPKEV